MLEHLPRWLGQALDGVRAGAEKLAIANVPADVPALDLSSPAFANGGRLPVRFTADGEGVSPPLTWGQAPPGTALLALLVEDADAPLPQPVVHGLLWGIPADSARLEEGALIADGAGGPDGDVGRNTYGREGWLPPDPPNGHGEHRYAFQLFALAPGAEPPVSPGRSALLEAMAGRILAAGVLTGTYSRGEEADAGTGAAFGAALA